MSPRIILRKLRAVAADITAEIDNPNYGGCCVIAAAMGAALEELGIDVECVTRVRSHWGADYNSPAQARPHIMDPANDFEWVSNGVNFNHVAIRFKIGKLVYTWDSDTGPLPRVLMFGRDRQIACRPGEGLTVREAYLLGKHGTWNPSFCRTQIPHIYTIIRRHFPKGLENV